MTGTRAVQSGPEALLDLAERVLLGTAVMPKGTRTRASAVLARTALEQVVDSLCAQRGLNVAQASMRVRLACLLTVSRPLAGRAALAWWGLSRACHQHAYEIAPHYTEVEHLINTVRSLVGEVVAPAPVASSTSAPGARPS